MKKQTYFKENDSYDKYGGWKYVKGRKTGFFHLEKLKDKWWLVDPEGNGFISKGVSTIYFGGDQVWQKKERPYNEAIIKKYGNRKKWLKEVTRRLKEWNFNSLGAWCYEQELREQFPYVEILDIAWRVSEKEDIWRSGGFPDVFDEKFEEIANQTCKKLCKPNKNNPFLIGYFTDNELRWQADWRSEDSLLAFFLKFPKISEGYKQAQKFLKIKGKNASSITSKDEKEFLRIVARKYFEICYEAIRRYDKNHLIFGCRFGEVPQEGEEWYKPTPKEVIEEMKPFVDVFSYNCYFLIKNQSDKKEFTRLINKYTKISEKAILISEFSFLGVDAGYPSEWPKDENKYPKPGILEVQVANQKERADAIENYIKTLLENSFAIGYHWFQYVDYPYLGRSNDGVAANYGLVKINDSAWNKLVKKFRAINKSAEKIHLT